MTARPLAGRVAAVTGGSGGIGSAILHHLTEAGAVACSLDLNRSRLDANWVATDMRDDASVAAAIDGIERHHGRLDLLIHAAGISHDAVLWKMPLEQWDRVMNVNLRGAFLLLRHGIPALRRASGGRVVLIGSINGSRGKLGTGAYSASKAGLIGLARTAARETGRFGICVNVIEPGWVRTPLTDTLPREVVDAAVSESLLGKLLEPSDIARAVTFLCGPGGDAITGQVLRVDGGQYLGGW
jgi:NAD(P)-dependent dehydrogenase (short-subunit alcohol dehydrogenase family)